MDPVRRVALYLIDNIGHMTRPGSASYDPVQQHWYVPIACRTDGGDVVVGDVELDKDGHILFAPSREELVARLESLGTTAAVLKP